MRRILSLLLVLVATTALALDTPDYTVVQATFLQAKAAKVVPNGDNVIIQVEGLQPGESKGIVLTFDDRDTTSIEATTLIEFNGFTVGLWPAKVIYPDEDGQYTILGKPGERFGIRAETSKGTKQFEVSIEGKPSPPPAPPVDVSDLQKKVSVAVATLNDPVTQKAIKTHIDKLLLDFPTDLTIAIASLKEAIRKGLEESMAQLKPPYKDWYNGFRIPIDTALQELNIQTAPQFKVAVQAISKGLE